MRIERLFHVLVLTGAALGSACGESADGGGGGGAAGGPRAGGGGGAGSDGSRAGGGAGSDGSRAGGGSDGARAGAASGTDPATSGGRGGSAGATGADGGLSDSDAGAFPEGGSAAPLECSAPPDPRDPCGCPCCWVTSCLNTESCCDAFCNSGDDGAGCCAD